MIAAITYTSRMKRVVYGLCLGMMGCVASANAPVRAPRAQIGFSEHTLLAAAESARARAAVGAADGAPGVVRSIQLRSSRASVRDVETGQNIAAGVRAQLDRPWRVSAQNKGGEAGINAAAFTADAAGARARALTCDESVQGRANAQRQSVVTAHGAKLERVLAWTAAFREAGSLDPITASRTELLVKRKLLSEVAPEEAFRIHDTIGELPALATLDGVVLDRDPQRVIDRIRAEHPTVRAHLSAAEADRQLSAAESGRRIPWFDFIELGYGFDGQGLRDVRGIVAVEIPLDDGSRGRARRYQQLGVSEEYEAESEAALLTRQAVMALQVLNLFGAQAAQLSALQTQANEAEALALRFLDERRESPDKVAQLLSETYAGRVFVLEAQERAGRAACALEYATGTSYTKWPRLVGAK